MVGLGVPGSGFLECSTQVIGTDHIEKVATTQGRGLVPVGASGFSVCSLTDLDGRGREKKNENERKRGQKKTCMCGPRCVTFFW